MKNLDRIRESIAAGHYDGSTLEGELALWLTASRLVESLTGSTSIKCQPPSAGAAPADDTASR